MARYPGAVWRPIPPGPNDPVITPTIVILHVAVSRADSLHDYFNGPSGGIESHFYVQPDTLRNGHPGGVEQYRDTGREADANFRANSFTGPGGKLCGAISVETAGMEHGEWSESALNRIKALLLWAREVHGIPLRPTPGPFEPGVSYHVMWGAPGPYTPVKKSCLPTDTTDVLTRRGWVNLSEVTVDDEVASVSMDSGITTFDRPIGIVEPHEDGVVVVNGFESTADHAWLAGPPHAHANECSCGYRGTMRDVKHHRTYHGANAGGHHVVAPPYKLMPAADLRGKYRYRTSVDGSGPGLPLTDQQIRLMVWLQGDGHFMRDRRDAPVYGVEWHLSKQRKIERVTALLDEMDIAYSHTRNANDSHRIRVYGDEARAKVIGLLPTKKFGWDLLDLGPDQAAVFLEELLHVDGSHEANAYFTMDTVNADVVQAIGVLNGVGAKQRRETGSRLWWVNMSPGERLVNTVVPGRRTEVGCLTTVNGTLIIRQAGKPLVIGNCPGPDRVRQFHDVLVPWMAEQTDPDGGAVMTLTPADLDAIVKAVMGAKVVRNQTVQDPGAPGAWFTLPQAVSHIEARTEALVADGDGPAVRRVVEQGIEVEPPTR